MPAPSAPPHIVCLETMHCPLPPLSFPHTLITYHDTASDQIAARLRPATIAITTVIPITPAILAQCPSLRLIVIWATGTEWLDRADCAARGIWVINCPGTNIEAVGEHALGFYFAARRKLVEMDRVVKRGRLDGGIGGEWVEKGTLTTRWDGVGGPPLSCRQEVVGIVGYGSLGRRIEGLCHGVGMGRVVLAGRKGVTDLLVETRRDQEGLRLGVASLPFEEVLRTASVLVICCPRDASTIDLIGEAELKSMRKEAIVVNVARGGIVNETALAKALTAGWIAAAATDVLEQEPGGRGTTPLLPLEGEVPNLTITPHIAWFAAQTMENLKVLLEDGIKGWMEGKPINVVVPGRGEIDGPSHTE